MKRINVTMDNELMDALFLVAEQQRTSVNLLINSILTAAMSKQGFIEPTKNVDVKDIVREMIIEAENRESGEFTAYDLKAFNKVAIGQLKDGEVIASPLRARIGKSFNYAVRQGTVKNVTAVTKTGKNGEKVAVTRNRNSLYMKD